MPENEIAEINRWMMKLAEPGSKTALRAASSRFEESQRPEGERICYDPYAIHFISKNVLEWAARNPEKMKVIKEVFERSLPGFSNSIIARVRYFDDFVKKSMDEGLEQFVILGAGYDTRAYRIEGLEKIRNFRNLAAQVGEQLQFGIKDGNIEAFLSERGFSNIQNVTSEDYRKAYFTGVNKDRSVCSLLSFAHAVVDNI